MDRAEKALTLQMQGYNCAQAVLCACADMVGIDEDTAFKISQGFGGGMGGMRDGTCGAVSAMYMLAGFMGGEKSKAETYALVRKMAEEFKKMNTSVICGELMGLENGKKLRSCPGCVEDAVKITEKLYSENNL